MSTTDPGEIPPNECFASPLFAFRPRAKLLLRGSLIDDALQIRKFVDVYARIHERDHLDDSLMFCVSTIYLKGRSFVRWTHEWKTEQQYTMEHSDLCMMYFLHEEESTWDLTDGEGRLMMHRVREICRNER